MFMYALCKIVMLLCLQASEELRSNPQYLTEEKHFDYTTAFKAVDVEGLGPCDAGFPVYVERNIPVVLAIKGSVKSENNQEQGGNPLIPTEIRTKLMPVLNILQK